MPLAGETAFTSLTTLLGATLQMPSVTHDGRSFMLDSRRIWLVSGQIPYTRLARDVWADRIHAAKQAGLNTIETPVFWNRHEPRPGKFDFSGDNDLKHFISLIGRAGMHCILGLGPYVGSEWDMGGLPPWLLESPTTVFRTQNAPFLEAASRFITAVAEQVRSLQATASGVGGPIVLVECESDWTCGHETLANSYIGELIRYVREAGLSVPIINSNNLWQGVEGQIDGWSGTQDLLSTSRQLASVRTSHPRVVIDFAIAKPLMWGRPEPAPVPPMVTQRRLAEALAGGAQYNMRPFSGGTNFGFSGGRSEGAADEFMCAEFGRGAPISASGQHGECYNAVRRLNHFASRFGRVLANLDPAFHPVVIDPSPDVADTKGGKASARQELSVVHAKGSQGSVVFVFGDEGSARTGVRQSRLLLADGTTMPVTLGQQAVAWCLIDVHVSSKAHLDYCNLNAFAAVGQIFVCYGPGGSRGMLSVNGSPLEVVVPSSGKMPLTIDHETLTIVVANEEQIDSIAIGEDAALIGVSGITPEGFPILPVGVKTYTRAGADGVIKQVMVESRSTSGQHGGTLPVGQWSSCGVYEYQEGSGARFASISGPSEMALMGCPVGYAWYRMKLHNDGTKKAKLLFPNAADRLHVFLEGQSLGVVGRGLGAEQIIPASLRKGEQTLVVLAENLGRFSGGMHLGERKGLHGEAYEAVAFKMAAPKLQRGEPVEILPVKAPVWGVCEGDTTSPDRVSWTLNHRRKTPIIMMIGPVNTQGFMMLNGKVLQWLDASGPFSITFTPEQLGKGSNSIQFAPFGHGLGESSLEQLSEAVSFYEGVTPLCSSGDMAFAKWEPPLPSAFTTGRADKTVGPRWFKGMFTPPDSESALFFEPVGLTKGQFYVNGRHVSRYFVATAAGKKVGPQDRYFIPRAFTRPKVPNEIMIFDESGNVPSKSRLTIE